MFLHCRLETLHECGRLADKRAVNGDAEAGCQRMIARQDRAGVEQDAHTLEGIDLPEIAEPPDIALVSPVGDRCTYCHAILDHGETLGRKALFDHPVCEETTGRDEGRDSIKCVGDMLLADCELLLAMVGVAFLAFRRGRAGA